MPPKPAMVPVVTGETPSRARHASRPPGSRGELDLHAVERGERVGQGERVVRERARVENDRRAPAAGVVDGVDQVALVVRLQVLELVALRGGRAWTSLDVVGEGRPSVDLRLARAEEVQVRAREQENGRADADQLPTPTAVTRTSTARPSWVVDRSRGRGAPRAPR